MASGTSINVSWDLFGDLLGPLGASWAHPGELLGTPSGILEGFLGSKTPKMPSRTAKTSPRPPPEPSKRVPQTPKRLPNCSPRSPKGSQRSYPRGHEEREKLSTLERYPRIPAIPATASQTLTLQSFQSCRCKDLELHL